MDVAPAEAGVDVVLHPRPCFRLDPSCNQVLRWFGKEAVVAASAAEGRPKRTAISKPKGRPNATP